MFEVGDRVVYGHTGVCKIEDITHIDMDGVDKAKLYYILIPMNEKKSKLYIPTDNEKVIMRKVITKNEAEHLVEEISDIEGMEIAPNDKLREEKYKEILKTCDCRECVSMIKTIYTRKQDLILQGKKLPNTDEKYLRQAEDSLYSELAVALEIDKSSMLDYIEKRVKNNK